MLPTIIPEHGSVLGENKKKRHRKGCQNIFAHRAIIWISTQSRPRRTHPPRATNPNLNHARFGSSQANLSARNCPFWCPFVGFRHNFAPEERRSSKKRCSETLEDGSSIKWNKTGQTWLLDLGRAAAERQQTRRKQKLTKDSAASTCRCRNPTIMATCDQLLRT